MATITKLMNIKGELSYRAQVRVKQNGKIIFTESRSFPREKLASDWAARLELQLKEHGALDKRKIARATLGDLITRYADEMNSAGQLGRTKSYVLDSLRAHPIGNKDVLTLDSSDIVQHCKGRQEEGAGPATVLHDVSYIKSVLEYAKCVLGLPVSGRAVDDAMGTLHQLNLVGKSQARTRRPTEDELTHIYNWLRARQEESQAFIPHVDIVRFAMASAMRAAEIERLRWDDLDEVRKLVLVRQRKDPRSKQTTFLERGFALCPPEGGTPSGPS